MKREGQSGKKQETDEITLFEWSGDESVNHNFTCQGSYRTPSMLSRL